MYEKENANLRMLFRATAWTKPCFQFQMVQVSCGRSVMQTLGASQNVLVPAGDGEGDRERGSEMELAPALSSLGLQQMMWDERGKYCKGQNPPAPHSN